MPSLFLLLAVLLTDSGIVWVLLMSPQAFFRIRNPASIAQTCEQPFLFWITSHPFAELDFGKGHVHFTFVALVDVRFMHGKSLCTST